MMNEVYVEIPIFLEIPGNLRGGVAEVSLNLCFFIMPGYDGEPSYQCFYV